jgi:hypothetical protein
MHMKVSNLVTHFNKSELPKLTLTGLHRLVGNRLTCAPRSMGRASLSPSSQRALFVHAIKCRDGAEPLQDGRVVLLQYEAVAHAISPRPILWKTVRNLDSVLDIAAVIVEVSLGMAWCSTLDGEGKLGGKILTVGQVMEKFSNNTVGIVLVSAAGGLARGAVLGFDVGGGLVMVRFDGCGGSFP